MGKSEQIGTNRDDPLVSGDHKPRAPNRVRLSCLHAEVCRSNPTLKVGPAAEDMARLFAEQSREQCGICPPCL